MSKYERELEDKVESISRQWQMEVEYFSSQLKNCEIKIKNLENELQGKKDEHESIIESFHKQRYVDNLELTHESERLARENSALRSYVYDLEDKLKNNNVTDNKLT
jgi:hypothetical protein